MQAIRTRRITLTTTKREHRHRRSSKTLALETQSPTRLIFLRLPRRQSLPRAHRRNRLLNNFQTKAQITYRQNRQQAKSTSIRLI